MSGHFQVEHVDAREFLEQDGLAFHHRLGRERADIAEAEYGGAICDDRDEILPDGVIGGAGRIFGYGQTGRGDAGRIGEGQVTLVSERFCRVNLQFSRLGTSNGSPRRALRTKPSSLSSYTLSCSSLSSAKFR